MREGLWGTKRAQHPGSGMATRTAASSQRRGCRGERREAERRRRRLTRKEEEGGGRSAGCEARVCPVGAGAWGDGGLGAERMVGIGQNTLHAKTGDPANQHAARAHPSLDNENDHRVKIDFNCCEDPMAQACQNADRTADKAPIGGALWRRVG